MTVSVDSTARDQAAAVRRREISARELLDLHLARIGERNPELNAIVSLDEERAREAAAAADEALASGAEVGALHGLPFAFKDTHGVAGWRTTYGSPLFADHVADHDDLIVERVRRAGVVVIGKTNVPEFAAGSHTFNRVFGLTRNPVDPLAVRRRLVRRSRLRARVRHGAARRRLRHGRLAAQPGVVLRGRRAAAVLGPGAGVAALQPVGDHLGRRPDGPQRRRPRPAALGDGRSGPARTAGAHRSRLVVRATARPARSPGCAWRSRPTWAAPSRSTPRSPGSSRRPRPPSPTRVPRSPTPIRCSPRPTTPSGPCGRGTSRRSSA